MIREEATETWKAVPGYSAYEVSDQGRVRSRADRRSNRWRVLKTGKFVDKLYRRVLLRGDDGKRRHVMVHVLVLEVFVGPRPDGMQCCHGDGNPLNNRLDNLRWGTPGDNASDRIRHDQEGGRRWSNTMRKWVERKPLRGEDAGHRKLNDTDVREIRLLRNRGVGRKEIAARFGIALDHVTDICAGKAWSWLDPEQFKEKQNMPTKHRWISDEELLSRVERSRDQEGAGEMKMVSFRVPKDLAGALEAFAEQQGIGLQALMRDWLESRMKQECAQRKEQGAGRLACSPLTP